MEIRADAHREIVAEKDAVRALEMVRVRRGNGVTAPREAVANIGAGVRGPASMVVTAVPRRAAMLHGLPTGLAHTVSTVRQAARPAPATLRVSGILVARGAVRVRQAGAMDNAVAVKRTASTGATVVPSVMVRAGGRLTAPGHAVSMARAAVKPVPATVRVSVILAARGGERVERIAEAATGRLAMAAGPRSVRKREVAVIAVMTALDKNANTVGGATRRARLIGRSSVIRVTGNGAMLGKLAAATIARRASPASTLGAVVPMAARVNINSVESGISSGRGIGPARAKPPDR